MTGSPTRRPAAVPCWRRTCTSACCRRCGRRAAAGRCGSSSSARARPRRPRDQRAGRRRGRADRRRREPRLRRRRLQKRDRRAARKHRAQRGRRRCARSRHRWGDDAALRKLEPKRFDCVVGSDLLYDPSSYTSLLKTLEACGCEAHIAITRRHAGERAFFALAERRFDVVATTPLRWPADVRRPDASAGPFVVPLERVRRGERPRSAATGALSGALYGRRRRQSPAPEPPPRDCADEEWATFETAMVAWAVEQGSVQNGGRVATRGPGRRGGVSEATRYDNRGCKKSAPARATSSSPASLPSAAASAGSASAGAVLLTRTTSEPSGRATRPRSVQPPASPRSISVPTGGRPVHGERPSTASSSDRSAAAATCASGSSAARSSRISSAPTRHVAHMMPWPAPGSITSGGRIPFARPAIAPRRDARRRRPPGRARRCRRRRAAPIARRRCRAR